MAQFRSNEALKRFLIQSKLVSPHDWEQTLATLRKSVFFDADDVAGIVDKLAAADLLTPLQRNRILGGEGESLLLGGYKLQYRNGSGSFARVFRAATLDGRRTVALKLLRDRWAQDPDAVRRFHREARISQRFRHPNIVPIWDIVTEGDHHFIVMEFIEGGNLRDFVRIRANVTPAESAQCVYDICSGLSYANSMGTTHRDLKLTNVLMSSDRVARLVDFGLAGADTSSKSFTSDEVHRAIEYASLERGTNAPKNDPRTDIFFAGAILYELLSSESPWPRTRDREERRLFSRYAQIRPLHTFRPDLPQSMLDITAQMLAVSPSERYQTADEVCADLQVVLKQFGVWKERSHPVVNGQVIPPEIGFHLLIVDPVEKRVEALKQYFGSRHGFKLTFCQDPHVALRQLKGRNPPAGVLLLADTTRDAVLEIFPEVQAWGRTLQTPCLAVFSEQDEELIRQTITSTRFGSTMFQPATLRDIRRHFETKSGSSVDTHDDSGQIVE
ncbi:MAG: serine/threonine protein kinase [Fuerstiella sp.]|nr:serine/threonine protein kinase [Fuerstiella sp.]